MDAQIEQQAAATLLSEGMKVPVTAPLFFRWFGKKRLFITITPPTQGTLHRIGNIALKAGITEDIMEEAADQLKYSWAISRILATAWLNSYLMGNPFFACIVGFYFRWHMDNTLQWHAMKITDLLSNKKAFSNTIRLVSGLRLTAPNLSQKVQGS